MCLLFARALKEPGSKLWDLTSGPADSRTNVAGEGIGLLYRSSPTTLLFWWRRWPAIAGHFGFITPAVQQLYNMTDVLMYVLGLLKCCIIFISLRLVPLTPMFGSFVYFRFSVLGDVAWICMNTDPTVPMAWVPFEIVFLHVAASPSDNICVNMRQMHALWCGNHNAIACELTTQSYPNDIVA